MRSAAELGRIRFRQHATVHQLLREYQVLADLLEGFLLAEVANVDPPLAAEEVGRVMHRVTQSLRVLQQQTVDTFETFLPATDRSERGRRRGGGEAQRHGARPRQRRRHLRPAGVQHLFREFARAHAHRDGDLRGQGLGLGLSMVRECMDAAGGSVRLESEEGQWTAVTLSWPSRTKPAASSPTKPVR